MDQNRDVYETECHCNGTKCIKGIECDVRNCAYHGEGSHCLAGCICIGPSDATTSANTVCATFKPRTY